jgi:hypothetical protein
LWNETINNNNNNINKYKLTKSIIKQKEQDKLCLEKEEEEKKCFVMRFFLQIPFNSFNDEAKYFVVVGCF